MLKIGEQHAVNILRFFDDLPDPRSKVNRLHRLGDVIVIAICAVIASADGPTAIAKWAKLNEVWLRRHLALPNGIPGKDTFRRVLGLLSPAAFQECFRRWLESLSASADDEPGDKRHVAIDGKTMRRSHDKRNGLGAMHIVSAWASSHGITLGQVATEEKSNEITAIPQLLEIIDVEEAIVTIDAAGCQKNIAAQIIQGKGDYVLALKGNQSKLFDDGGLPPPTALARWAWTKRLFVCTSANKRNSDTAKARKINTSSIPTNHEPGAPTGAFRTSTAPSGSFSDYGLRP